MKTTVMPFVFIHEDEIPEEFFKTFAGHMADAIEDFLVLHQTPCSMAIGIKKPFPQETMQ